MPNSIKYLKISILSAFAIVAGASHAVAGPAKCGDRDTLVKMLKTKYKEQPVAMGLSQKSTEAFEVFVSDKGTWTVVMTTSKGVTCVMAVGHSWKELPKEMAGTIL